MRFLNTGLFLLLSFGANAQSSTTLKASAKQAATTMATALVNKDYNTFIKHTYPTVVAKADGGTEKLIADLKRQIQNIEKSGNTIQAIWPGDPSDMVDTGGEMQCTIPQHMKMKMPNGVLTRESTLVGMSRDNGKTWYFIDASEQTIVTMREHFPNVSSKLVIPPTPEPKFVPAK